MTREQAKSELMQLYGSLSEKKKMALDVLMAQADGDLISREAVIEAIYDMEILKYRIDLEKVIKELPRVAIPNKVGHWEYNQYDGNPNIGNWHCSECRTIIPHMPEETDNTPIYKWCPICGAKMD